ncbi:MAG: Rrf2 family transcriptional regulator [Bacteroidota bacterium]|nr:Rrf2 family transcriptional regulator [Bacteroidota bacterium]
MILNKTSEYALKILSFMATENFPQYTAHLLYDKLSIPKRYGSRLMTQLTKSGFIKSNRGRNGGYVFAKKLEDIYLSDIIDSIEGFENFDKCLIGLYQCDLDNPCPMHDIWAETKQKVIDTLKNTSLADLGNSKIADLKPIQ